MFITMNTVARTVENDRIHLKRHHIYVKRPESRAKNEYHSLVSPIVFKGGRPRLTHRRTMNAAMIRMESELNEIAHPLRCRYLTEDTDQWSFAQNAENAPPADNIAADIPNHMKRSHVMASVCYIVISPRATDKEHERSCKHHDHSGQGAIPPRFSYYLEYAVLARSSIVRCQIEILTET